MLWLRRYERISVENFRYKGSPPTNHSSSQKTRLNVLLYGIKMWTDLSTVLSHHTHVWQTDGQTEFSSLDRVCIACSAVEMRGCLGLTFKDFCEPPEWLNLTMSSYVLLHFIICSLYIYLTCSTKNLCSSERKNDNSDTQSVNTYKVNKHCAEYIFDLPNIAFGPKMSRKYMASRSSCNVPWDVAALSSTDYLYISRDACRTNHDCVF